MFDLVLQIRHEGLSLKLRSYGNYLYTDKIIFKNLSEEPDDVVAVGQDDQTQNDDEAHCFGHFHELVAGLATRDDLNQ